MLADNSQHCWMLHVAPYREVDYQNANTVLSAKTQNTCSCLIVACSCQSTTKKPEAEAHVRVHTLLHVVACCCVLLGIVAQGFNPVKLLSQKIPKFLLFPVFPDRRSLALQCCRLHCSFNTIGVMHAHYTWSAKYYGLYPSHDALHVPALLGVVASVCTSLPTWTQ